MTSKVPFCHSFLKHYLEKTRSYHFKENRPMNANNYGALVI